jgi:hypothetical protein
MRMRIFLLAAILSVSATASFASMITKGTFSIAGTIFVTGLAGAGGIVTPAGTCPAGEQCIFFQDTATPPVNNRADVSPLGLPNGDIPTSIAGNDNGVISNLLNPPSTPPSFPAVTFFAFVPVTGVTTVLELNSFPLGINGTAQCGLPAAPGQLCSPAGSPFNLQNLTATSSTATFKMGGITNDSSSTWTGIFASQFNNMSYQDVLAQLATNGFASNTFSGQITLVAGAVPEPTPMVLAISGLGLVLLSATFRRRSAGKS